MNTRKSVLLRIALLSVLAFTLPVTSGSNGGGIAINLAAPCSDGIILEGADTCRQETPALDPQLPPYLAAVAARIIVEYANTIRHIVVPALPSELQQLLDQVSPHIIVEYANTIRHIVVPALPGELQTLLNQVSPRIIIEYANTNRVVTLVYPHGLFNNVYLPLIRR